MVEKPAFAPTTTIGASRFFGPQPAPPPVELRPTLVQSARIICIASGKGGTGKSFVSATLAQQFAKEGKKTLLVDADFGLSDAHLYLGIKPQKDITALFNGLQGNDSVLLKGWNDLNYLYGGSGLANLAQLTPSQWEKVLKALSYFEQRHSHIVVDLGAGIGPQVLPYLLCADEVVLVANPDPVAMLDVFATIKVLHKNNYSGTLYLVLNKSNTPRGEKASSILKNAADKLTPSMPIYYLGPVAESLALLAALKKRQPFLHLFPYDPACIDLKKIAQKLLQIEAARPMTARTPYFQRVKRVTDPRETP